MSQITIRSLPKDLEKSIRELSKQQGTSLNKTLIGLLEKATGLDHSRTAKKRDLSKIAGTWSSHEADEFEDRIREFESVDEELWK